MFFVEFTQGLLVVAQREQDIPTHVRGQGGPPVLGEELCGSCDTWVACSWRGVCPGDDLVMEGGWDVLLVEDGAGSYWKALWSSLSRCQTTGATTTEGGSMMASGWSTSGAWRRESMSGQTVNNMSRRMSLRNDWTIDGTLAKPYAINRYSKWPAVVLNAIVPFRELDGVPRDGVGIPQGGGLSRKGNRRGRIAELLKTADYVLKSGV